MKESSIAVLLGGGGKKKGESLESFDPEAEVGEGPSHDDAFADAAEAAMYALHENDSEAFAEHLKDAIVICVEKHMGEGY